MGSINPFRVQHLIYGMVKVPFGRVALLHLEEDNRNSLRSETEVETPHIDSTESVDNFPNVPDHKSASDIPDRPSPRSFSFFPVILETLSTPSFLKKQYTDDHSPSTPPSTPTRTAIFHKPTKTVRTIPIPAFRKPKFYRAESQSTKLADIQFKRAQIEEKYIAAKNRLDFNKRRNNLAGDRLKREQQEVSLFLEKLREVQTLEREYFKLHPEPNKMESDEVYDTTDSEIQIDLSNQMSDEIENERPDSESANENKEGFDVKKQTELSSKGKEQSAALASAAPFSLRKRILFKSDAMGKVMRTLVKYERGLSKAISEAQDRPSEPLRSSIVSPPHQSRSFYKRNKGSFRDVLRLRPVRRCSKAFFSFRTTSVRDRSVREMPSFCGKRRAAVLCEVSM